MAKGVTELLVDQVVAALGDVSAKMATMQQSIQTLEQRVGQAYTDHCHMKPLIDDLRNSSAEAQRTLNDLHAGVSSLVQSQTRRDRDEEQEMAEQVGAIHGFVKLVRTPVAIVIAIVLLLAALFEVRDWVQRAIGMSAGKQEQGTSR